MYRKVSESECGRGAKVTMRMRRGEGGKREGNRRGREEKMAGRVN